MKLYLFAFGRLKTPGLRDTADYYKKILRPWAQLEEIELKPLSVQDKSPATRRIIQDKESAFLLEKISSVISPRGQFYLMDETGRAEATLAWAERIRSWENESVPEIAFCIGSSLGFADALRRKSKGSLSFGPQTFSHELARVVLLEQVYRSYSVVRGHPYHNEGS
ncbi:MAG: 23S rRNA (pseudouridine(1915)-N(3))-methyltransferase RlmH [Methylotenera sp.]|nr:23S rRNA (pseudouridine(1915)-N(3))-methyltransferase RlmH [Oligoflexia bacterium]